MASVGEKRPYAIRNGFIRSRLVWSFLVFDLKTEPEWGEPGPPTVPVPDHPDQLGPCMTVRAEAAPLKVFSRRPYTPNLRLGYSF
jgi:hypothetical protein